MIRTAAAADLPALRTLEQELFGVDAWSEQAIRDEVEGPQSRVLVEVDELDIPRGYVVTRNLGEMVDLLRIAVGRLHQRRGYASELLDAALEGTESAARMLLEVSVRNTDAVGFYVARQFSVIDVRPHYYRDGSEALVMCRWLPAAVHLDR